MSEHVVPGRAGPHLDHRRRRDTTRWLTATAAAGWMGYLLVTVAMWLSSPTGADTSRSPAWTSHVGAGHAGQLSSSPSAFTISWPVSDLVWIVLMWIPMIAMMAPWIAFNVRFVATRSPQRRRTIAGLQIAAGWAAVWLVALVPIASASVLLVSVLPQPWAVVFAVAAAAAWQLTPWKRRALSRCDRTMAPPLDSRAARIACLGFGAQLGGWCVVSDWALMLTMGAAHHNPLVVIGLLLISWFERFRLPHHDRRSAQTSVLVAACGAAAVTVALAQG